MSCRCSVRAKASGDLVSPGRDDQYQPRPKSSAGWFAAAVTKAKVQKTAPHDLRHTCASLAVSAGVNVLALQRMLGHTSAKVTLDTYADLFDEDLDAVAVTLDSRYSRESAAQNVAKGREGWLLANTKSAHYLRKPPVQFWRWRRDLNPRTGVTRHTLSRRAP